MRKKSVSIAMLVLVAASTVFLFSYWKNRTKQFASINGLDKLLRLPEYSNSTLGLTEPVEIPTMSHHADGGSVGITFVDAAGKKVYIRYDQNGEGSKKDRHLYICDQSDGYEPSFKISINSRIEKEVLKHITTWRAENLPEWQKEPDQIVMFPSTGSLVCLLGVSGLIDDLEARNSKNNQNVSAAK